WTLDAARPSAPDHALRAFQTLLATVRVLFGGRPRLLEGMAVVGCLRQIMWGSTSACAKARGGTCGLLQIGDRPSVFLLSSLAHQRSWLFSKHLPWPRPV